MSDRDLRSEHNYPLLNNGVIVLSESIDMPVGKTLSYTLKEMEYMFDRSTFDRHDDTDDVYQPRWPWCFPTISPDVPSGEHICYTTQCDPEADMAEIKAAIEGTEPFFVTRLVFDAEEMKVHAYIDGSRYWDQTDWQSTKWAYLPIESSLGFEVLQSGTSLHCFLPQDLPNDEPNWSRLVRPVRAEETITIEKRGDLCFIIPLNAGADVSGTSFNTKDFIELRSSEATFTAQGDTIVALVYK